ncbi:MAG TPA: hypothetical protein VFS67_33425 [Polyangiaceae bacterium]|nr:hypothetical protein [Polyangiaceae bacterium]
MAAGVVLALVLGACGPAAMIGPEPNEPSTEPHATGAQEHRAAAEREEKRLSRHQELYDPRAQESIQRCDPDRAQRAPGEPICWVETINPTAIHLQEVREHRMRAVEHRKAARDLQDVEERSCAGLAAEDREISPFSHGGDILGVNPLEEPIGNSSNKRRLVGATILFRPVPGLTAAGLQQLVNCHLARNATIGYTVASHEMEHCPLTERGATASVRPVSSGLAVDVRAEDPAAAQAIWRRAQQLAVVPREPKIAAP